ncbi:phage replisome organizer N-terminal domain-containing protein [Candidatus Enterococcus clewellii]|uniref:Phage replisome organiser N-terminal domain-containing protein n=1 Tax=Candidatus Enterococcus clewellii TaxID=1834193 RepID=A0A242K8I2_9ENTE|nr:phage replisome organizer N-terminal domain-containing protein [Enterococcus sp. 9E7_DIV0242]OTP17266.1 hypothetical protein A5888_001404 [Enterococcus sp. 9E7_DIV0242]
MSDKQKKRYYWLKLKENFFEEDTITWLEEQPNGKEHCLIYLKLCLKSLKTDGVLARNVGNMMIPYDAETLARVTNSSPDTIKVAMDLFEKIGLIQILNDGEIYLNQLNELVGTETEYAKQKRLQRAKVDNVQKVSGQRPENVAQSIELEKELDIELEKELDIKKKEPTSKKPKPTRHKYGEYQNVLLSDQDMEKLKEEFPNDWEQRIEKVSGYCASTGKSYKNYLATIRQWAKRDNQLPQRVFSNRQPIRQEKIPDSIANPVPEEKLSAEQQAKIDKQMEDFLNRRGRN